MKKYQRAKAVVSLDAIERNFQAMRENIAQDTKMIAVIKADGYGHGAVPVARLVEDHDYIWGFATATAEEAFELREAGIKKPILILGIVFEEHYQELIRQDIRPAVTNFAAAEKLSHEAAEQGRTVHIHIALDTGMTRIGFADTGESVEEIRRIADLADLEIEGMFTHFARADELDVSPALVQLERYQNFAHMLEETGVSIPVKHCSNSAGIIRLPQANLDVVRAGITIYGIYPSEEVERDIIRLEPAMELKSHISCLKTVEAGTPVSYGGTYVTTGRQKIATIPVGYADGYARQLSGKGYVLIRGQKAFILGRVCMDQFMVDVTDIPDVSEGDEVTLIGRDGGECITMEELGDLSGRFSYEFACEISKRVPRVYIKDGKETESVMFTK